jgi:hypothetical protein
MSLEEKEEGTPGMNGLCSTHLVILFLS